MLLQAVIGRNWLEQAGTYWNWMKLAALAVIGRKRLENSGIGWNWLEKA